MPDLNKEIDPGLNRPHDVFRFRWIRILALSFKEIPKIRGYANRNAQILRVPAFCEEARSDSQNGFCDLFRGIFFHFLPR